MRNRLKQLLLDYSLEDILERGGLEPIDALELLIVYSCLSMEDIVEGTDQGEQNSGVEDDQL